MFRGLSLKWTEGFQGEEEIRDTNPFHFQSPVILFDGLVSQGGGGTLALWGQQAYLLIKFDKIRFGGLYFHFLHLPPTVLTKFRCRES